MANVAFVIVLGVALGQSQQVTVESLAAGVTQRHALYFGYEFEYDVTVVDAQSKMHTRDVFRMLASNKDSTRRPWRYWLRQVEIDSKWVPHRFLAYDGSKFASFYRQEEGEGKWHQAFINSQEVPNDYEPNVFDGFLTWNFMGIPSYMDPDGSVFNTLLSRQNVSIAGEIEFLGERCFRVQGADPQSKLNYQAIMTGSPFFVLLSFESHIPNLPSSTPFTKMSVTKIGQFESIRYPAAGTFRQEEVGMLKPVNYEFAVKCVKKLDAKIRDRWFDKWPPATGIADHINGVNIMIPPTDEQRRRNQLASLGKQKPKSWPMWKWAALFANAGGVILIVFWSWRRSRRR